MAKIFEAWCDRCNWFTRHIQVDKNNQTLIKCLSCLKWTNITFTLVDRLEGGKCKQPEKRGGDL
jgi:hypothetical protein